MMGIVVDAVANTIPLKIRVHSRQFAAKKILRNFGNLSRLAVDSGDFGNLPESCDTETR